MYKVQQKIHITRTYKAQANLPQYQQEFDCPECGQIFQSPDDVTKHKDEVHSMELVRCKAVCYHWRRGHSDRGNTCHFSHVERQNKSLESTSKPTTTVAICKNGPSCDWLKKGKCSFFHHKVGVQKPWAEQGEVCQGRGQESNNKKQPKKHVTKNHNKKHNLVQPD